MWVKTVCVLRYVSIYSLFPALSVFPRSPSVFFNQWRKHSRKIKIRSMYGEKQRENYQRNCIGMHRACKRFTCSDSIIWLHFQSKNRLRSTFRFYTVQIAYRRRTYIHTHTHPHPHIFLFRYVFLAHTILMGGFFPLAFSRSLFTLFPVSLLFDDEINVPESEWKTQLSFSFSLLVRFVRLRANIFI